VIDISQQLIKFSSSYQNLNSLEIYLYQGMALYHKTRYKEAEQALLKAIKDNVLKNKAKAWLVLVRKGKVPKKH
jgi:K+ transporter